MNPVQDATRSRGESKNAQTERRAEGPGRTHDRGGRLGHRRRSRAGGRRVAAEPRAPATFAAPPNGNNNWRITAPQTLNLSATDDVAVAKFQYSLDGGATYVDVPVTPGPAATANVPLSQEGNTTVRYRAVDSSGNVSRGATTNTTLNQASAAGATAVRLTSTTGRSAGDTLADRHGRRPGDGDDRDDRDAGSRRARSERDADGAAGERARRERRGGRHGALQHDRAADRHQGSGGDVGHAGRRRCRRRRRRRRSGRRTGDTQIRLASLTGRAAGDTLQLDQGPNAETVKIASVVDPAPAAPAPNVVLTSALTKTHLVGAAVYLPSIVDGKILQSQTLTPLRTDPRLRDATDTVTNGAGGAAIRRMTLDGAFMVPKTLPLNRLTVGKHTTTVALQDTAGSTLKYTNTFVVTTSFADLATVIDQYADNALRTTLNGATAVGATGLRLATPFGLPRRPAARRRLGRQPGDGDDRQGAQPAADREHDADRRGGRGRDRGPPRELHAERRHRHRTPRRATARSSASRSCSTRAPTRRSSPSCATSRRSPPAPAPNVVLSAPLAKDHAAGTATTLDERDPQRAADEGARDRRGGRQPAAVHLRREGDRAAHAARGRQGQGRRERHRGRDRRAASSSSAAAAGEPALVSAGAGADRPAAAARRSTRPAPA